MDRSGELPHPEMHLSGIYTMCGYGKLAVCRSCDAARIRRAFVHQPSAAAPGAAPSAITAAPGGAPAITAAPRGRLIYLWNMRGCTDGFPYPEVGSI